MQTQTLTQVDKDLIQQLDDITSSLEDAGCAVAFWHVRRQFNQDADRLANDALYKETQYKRQTAAAGIKFYVGANFIVSR